jgi:Ca-activated chloride channel family protein
MTFEWPLMLFGLALIPVIILLYLLAQRRRRAYAMRFTNLALLQKVAGRAPAWRRHVPSAFYLLGLAALLICLARPMAVVAVPKDQTAVILVMDVSGSMAANDLKPNRMVAAKEAAKAFVDKLPSQLQVGLVSFSTGAGVNAPLTSDRAQVKRAIDSLSANGGTAIGDGLATALDHLDKRPADKDGKRAPAMVVLLSDGASTSGQPPAQASARAKEAGIKVNTVGIGQRGAAPQLSGRSVPLDEATLRQIAADTGGQYFYAAESAELAQIYSDLGSQVAWVEERTEITALVSALATVFVLLAGLLSLRWAQQLP